jgi:hypothetical protein
MYNTDMVENEGKPGYGARQGNLISAIGLAGAVIGEFGRRKNRENVAYFREAGIVVFIAGQALKAASLRRSNRLH